MGLRVLEQHIAVFGESGSGKTVLLSSFYGLMREKQTQARTRLDVVADDAGQGDRLLSYYLGMSREGRAPAGNRFASIPHSFTAHLDHQQGSKSGAKYDGIRLIWHDYPGEWFHNSASGPTEEGLRAETFQKLLASDVALILVDGEKLAKNVGHESEYLKLLFTNVRNGLLPVVDELLNSGKPLARFPRIWMFALSKSDVLPNVEVTDFRDMVVLGAAHEVDQLRKLLERVVLGKDALSVGEDFVLLSSARFTPGAIEVAHRIGVDLLMPIATVLPLRRFLRWAEFRTLQGKVAETLLGHASAAAAVAVVLVGFLGRFAKLDGPIGKIAGLISSAISKEMIDQLVKLAGDKLREANVDAVAKGDYLRAALTQFGIDLEDGEKRSILLRSKR